MATPQSNGHTNGTPETGASRGERSLTIIDLIEEAEKLRTVFADAATRLARLSAGLKQHRRQSRAVQAAMQSLQQLKLG